MDRQTRQISIVNWNRAVEQAAAIAEKAVAAFQGEPYTDPRCNHIRERFGCYIATRIREELTLTDNGQPLAELLRAETPVQRKTD